MALNNHLQGQLLPLQQESQHHRRMAMASLLPSSALCLFQPLNSVGDRTHGSCAPTPHQIGEMPLLTAFEVFTALRYSYLDGIETRLDNGVDSRTTYHCVNSPPSHPRAEATLVG